MAGIYIHIPFCKKACHYCNFHFSTSLRLRNEMMDALLREIELQKDYLGQEPVETIYFGGGTPSLCTVDELEKMLIFIHSNYPLAANTEITLETNPDDINFKILEEWHRTGINRLSIGVQSFFDEDLTWMNRSHSAKQATDAIQAALKLFPNITIDLIYGVPYLTDDKWKYNVEKALSLKIPHISCYGLTVEPKTALFKMIQQKKSADVDSDVQSKQFLMLMQWMEIAGYEHYEISNYAVPGNRSRHNSSYWQGKKYLGIGPSAHSFDGQSRQWNISNNNLYIQSVKNKLIPFEKEILTSKQLLNEYIMTALRTKEGIHSDILTSRFEISINEFFEKATKYIQNSLMLVEGNSYKLTNEGKLLADGIAADLFY